MCIQFPYFRVDPVKLDVTFLGIFISAGTAGSSQINVLRREFHLSKRHNSRPHLTENTPKIPLMLSTKIRAVHSSICMKQILVHCMVKTQMFF